MRFPADQIPRLVTILNSLYKRTTLTYEEIQTTFETTSGVRQGGPESPFLFNLFIDFVMRIFINNATHANIKFYEHRYRINLRSVSREERLSMRSKNRNHEGNVNLPWCGYADDLILFIQSQSELQKATEILDNVFERFGLKINEQKTETMILNSTEPDYPKSIITIRNIPIKNVEKFKYLGAFTKYDQPNTGDVKLSYRIQTAISKFVEMSILLQNVKINLKSKLELDSRSIRKN
ncbi:uncharacterized protein [Clytia hemisphaerica]|uniref:uncharacterized protein n=1 Tax=Clytia hemisphaerica TaxID=252671 RepID=UPI0034D41BAB